MPENFNDAFLDRMYELYPELKDFDQCTGEIDLFAEILDALFDVLPAELDNEPLVVGWLMSTVNDPLSAASAIVRAYKIGVGS